MIVDLQSVAFFPSTEPIQVLWLITNQMLDACPANHPFSAILSQIDLKGLFSAKVDETYKIKLGKQIHHFLGLGSYSSPESVDIRLALGKKSSIYNEIEELAVVPPHVPSSDETLTIRAVVDGVVLGFYEWSVYKLDKKGVLQKIWIVSSHIKEVADQYRISSATNLARDLVNENADIITSEYFEKMVKEMVVANPNCKLRVIDAETMKSEGMSLFLAVNKASPKPPKLIIVEYTADRTSTSYTAVLGKGITFDSGGLNLKAGKSIKYMRNDMGGAAAIAGTLKAVLEKAPKKNILFAMAMAENMLDSNAYKPGDVIISKKGISVEIGNCDAEGRLVLADSIAYLNEHYTIDTLVDIATLTAAVVNALAHDHAGLFTNSDALSDKFIEISKKTDDKVWRMPYYKELKAYIKGDVAQLKNVGLVDGYLESSTAAAFIAEFLKEGQMWVHIDIAGVAFMTTKHRYFAHGGTGSGVRLLTGFLES